MTLNSVIFSEGKDFFENLSQKYTTHERGLFIMTPSGAGKTYYCKNQSTPDWIDGDELWCLANAQPDPETKWWDMGLAVINAVEQRCDVITSQAVEKGFRILGSVNYWYKPDAIVVPDWDILVRQIKMRQESGDYDGGLTESHHEQLRSHISVINEWNTKHGVPKYDSIENAIAALTMNA